jgi:hypothetical protein
LYYSSFAPSMYYTHHSGPYLQRGRGIGNLLGSLFRSVIPAAGALGRSLLKSPITKQVLKTAKRTAIEAGSNVLSDLAHGESVADSMDRGLNVAKRRVASAIDRNLPLVDESSADEASPPIVKRRKKPKRAKANKAHVKKRRAARAARDLFDAE